MSRPAVSGSCRGFSIALLALSLLLSTSSCAPSGPGPAPTGETRVDLAPSSVGLYDVWEIRVSNSGRYDNPYDFEEVLLEASFVSPSGRELNFFGFHDGDGDGGASGSCWKLRFPPDETGSWRFRLIWSDGTAGVEGGFEVRDTGLAGPLRIDPATPRFFVDARERPFDARGYSLHQYLEGKWGRGVFGDDAVADLTDCIETRVADRGYNLLMVAWPVFVERTGHHLWQGRGNSADFNRFNPRVWRRIETVIRAGGERGVQVFPFVGLVDQYSSRPSDDELGRTLRYAAARLGPFWNHFGFSPTWEYTEIWSDDQADRVMGELAGYLAGLPNPPLLAVHDTSRASFADWLGFSMRQRQSASILDGNDRLSGVHGGVAPEFAELPVIGSEDLWEYRDGSFGQPRNGDEVRRGIWGLLTAGVIPVYSETGLRPGQAPAGGMSNFSGEGEPAVRAALEFFHERLDYRRHVSMNARVHGDPRRVASGVPGEEMVIFAEDGGTVRVDLRGEPPGRFESLWFDPVGERERPGPAVAAGRPSTLESPFDGDSVLRLRREAGPVP